MLDGWLGVRRDVTYIRARARNGSWIGNGSICIWGFYAIGRNIKVNAANTGKAILVPLTTSLYVPGTLADTNNVIVDVGTGFYVEKVRFPSCLSFSPRPPRTTLEQTKENRALTKLISENR